MALPPSSPRLPSPPPAAEIQIGPNSPVASGSGLAQNQIEQQMEQTALDANSKRRIHPGTRAADFAVGPPLVPLNELDSAFQLQEHLSALHYFHTANNTQPISRETAQTLALPPPGTDRTLWLYELCRFLIAQCNGLIVGFLFDTPPCSAATCPEMRASEWQFLCAVHEQPKSCCAIDYCCHTLDWAANVVTNPKIFPSRFVFADAHDKSAAGKNLTNVFRRLHRIFAHAWFQHRGVFWSVEGQTGLYVLFKTVCDMYDLLPAENYKLPPEAEGLDVASSGAGTGSSSSGGAGDLGASSADDGGIGSGAGPGAENIPGLISVASLGDRKGAGFGANGPSPISASVTGRRSGPGLGPGAASGGGGGGGGGGSGVGGTNTRRHIRSSPSTGSAVTTVLEQDEEAASAAAAASSNNKNSSRTLLASPPSAMAAMAAHVAAPPSITVREHTDANQDGDAADVAEEPAKSETAVVPEDETGGSPASRGGDAADATADAPEPVLASLEAHIGAGSDAEPTEPALTQAAETAGSRPEGDAAALEDGAEIVDAPSSADDGKDEDVEIDAKNTGSAAAAAAAAAAQSEEAPEASETTTTSNNASLAGTSVLDFAPTAEETGVTSEFAEKVATAPEEAVEDDVPEQAAVDDKAETAAEAK